MSDFLQDIHSKNRSEVLKYSKSVVSSSNSLKDFFQNIFVIVALFKNVKLYNETFYYHPLVDLNSIKNIASMNLGHLSHAIPLKAIEILKTIPRNNLLKKNNNSKVEPEMLNSPLLIDDFIRSVLKRDFNTSRIEASKIIAMSDNPVSIFEVLMELSIPNFNLLGPITYSIYRAGKFSNNDFMNFIDILIASDIRFLYEKKFEKKKINPIIFFPRFKKKKNNLHSLVLFCLGLRLWNNESPRQLNFQKNILLFFERNFEVDNEKKNKFKPLNKTFSSLPEVLETKDPMYVSSFLYQSKKTLNWEWSIELLKRYDNNSKIKEKYLFIDSILYLVKNLRNEFLISLSQYLIYFDENYNK
tara:strand:- start:8191 stop:9261 length:1071 start_codon:yes stop_codon:yes gene_type:complete